MPRTDDFSTLNSLPKRKRALTDRYRSQELLNGTPLVSELWTLGHSIDRPVRAFYDQSLTVFEPGRVLQGTSYSQNPGDKLRDSKRFLDLPLGDRTLLIDCQIRIELPCSNQGATNSNRVKSGRAKHSDPGLWNIKLVHCPLLYLLHPLQNPINFRKQPSNGLVIYKGSRESSRTSIVGEQFVVHAFETTVIAGDFTQCQASAVGPAGVMKLNVLWLVILLVSTSVCPDPFKHRMNGVGEFLYQQEAVLQVTFEES